MDTKTKDADTEQNIASSPLALVLNGTNVAHVKTIRHSYVLLGYSPSLTRFEAYNRTGMTRRVYETL